MVISSSRSAFLFLVLAPGTALAERPISYHGALEASLAANPTLAGAQYSLEQADAGVVAARGIFDPGWTADLSYFQQKESGFIQDFGVATSNDTIGWAGGTGLGGSLATGTTWSVDSNMTVITRSDSKPFGELQEDDLFNSSLTGSITQNILRGSQMAYNLQNVTLAEQSRDIAQVTLQRTRQETLAGAAAAYWEWAYQYQLLQIAYENVDVAEEALRVVQLRVDAGELAPVEQTRQEADFVQKQADLIAAEHMTRTAADNLLLLLGEGPGQDVIPATKAGDVPEMDLDAQAAIDVALAQNLDLAIARANRESAELDLSVAKHGMLPTLSATVSSTLGDQAAGFGEALGGLVSDVSEPSVGVSGNWSMPLGNRAAKGTRDQAVAALYQRDVELQELERSVRAQVGQQVLALNSAARRVELADANHRLADETLRAEEALAEAGRAIQKDVLESRSAAELARVEAAKARTDYRQAQVELLRLQGQLSEDVP